MNMLIFTEFNIANLNKAFTFLEDYVNDSERDSVVGLRCNGDFCCRFHQLGRLTWDQCVIKELPIYGHIFTANIIKDNSISDGIVLLESSCGIEMQVDFDFSFPLMIIDKRSHSL